MGLFVCENLSKLAYLIIWLSFFWIGLSALYANSYCKKDGVNMSTFPGLLELYRRVFNFESKRLSVVILSAILGGAVLAVGMSLLISYAKGVGCIINIRA